MSQRSIDWSRLGTYSNGGEGYSNAMVLTSLIINRKPLGQHYVAGDDSTGKLAVRNPMYTGTGNSNAVNGEGGYLHQLPGWRAHFRYWQKVRRGYDTHVNFTQQYHTRTPIALPSVIPTRVPGIEH